MFIFKQETGCLYVFKSDADCERHMKIIHGKKGQEANPFGKKCNFMIDKKTKCGLVFPTQWYLTKHKRENGHFMERAKKGDKDKQ